MRVQNRVVAGVRCLRCGSDRIYSKPKSLCSRCYKLDWKVSGSGDEGMGLIGREEQERRSEGFVCACGSTSFFSKNMCSSCYNKWKRASGRRKAEKRAADG